MTTFEIHVILCNVCDREEGHKDTGANNGNILCGFAWESFQAEKNFLLKQPGVTWRLLFKI